MSNSKVFVRLRGTAECAYDDCSVSRCGDTQCFMAPTHQRSDVHLEPCIVHVIRLKNKDCDKDTEKHSTTKKLQCTMPSCRSTSEPHQIIVGTRGRCARRAHEFSGASDHCTHCWPYSQCAGTQTQWLSKSVNSFNFNLTSWTFARAVLNSQTICDISLVEHNVQIWFLSNCNHTLHVGLSTSN